MISFPKSQLLAMSFILPMDNLQDFTRLEFNKIKANQVKVENAQLQIEVNQSASPLIYKLKSPLTVKKVSWKISVSGQMNPSKDSFPEDSYFRLGLVARGEQKLSRLHRLIAADWVKKLFDLAPKDQGIDKIYFYMVGDSSVQLNKKRVHPSSELLKEEVISMIENGRSEASFNLDSPKDIVALWISIDGDQSKSQFKTTLEQVQLN